MPVSPISRCEDRRPAATLSDLIGQATARLRHAGMATPRLDADVLLRHALGIDRTRLFLRLPEPATQDVAATFASLVERRLGGEPLAYITGSREFMGLPFIATPDVLIPRPETELLVEWALGVIAERGGGPVRVADIGTGSGAIAISIAALAPRSAKVSVTGTDISAAALAVAARNRERIAPHHPVSFIEGSLAAPIREPVDLVLANLPYLTPGQIASNDDLNAEPRTALDGGPDGLDLIRKLIRDLPRILAPRAAAGFELDPEQCQAVRAALADAFPGGEMRIIEDLSGRERHLVLRTS